MSGTLTFPLHKVLELVQRAEKAPTETRRVTFDQMFDPTLRKDGKKPKGFDVTSEDVDLAKVPPCLILVGDTGVYLLSNDVPLDFKVGKDTLPVCYAAESDPTTMDFDTWYDAKRRIFGGDDGTIAIPASTVRDLAARLELIGMKPEKAKFTVSMSPTSISMAIT